MRRLLLSVVCLLGLAGTAQANPQSFPTGSLIIPMDATYQDAGVLRAYGLVVELLRAGVPVRWVIDPAKTWHASPCDTPGDECAWDCDIAGSGVKCPYPTGSPDFTTTSEILYSDTGLAGANALNHPYRGGPFVIDAADNDAAMPIIDAWNASGGVVSVHRAVDSFLGDVARDLVAAPTLAVLADGGAGIALAYLDAAGITDRDVIALADAMGDMGTCAAPLDDHQNGALFHDGLPAYGAVISTGWTAAERDAEVCDGTVITFSGREVVAEVRALLAHQVHFFAGGTSVDAFENAAPEGQYLTSDGVTIIPTPATVEVIHADAPRTQMDGGFALGGGFQNVGTFTVGRDVRLLTDTFVAGFLDGICNVRGTETAVTCPGQVSYLGGDAYTTATPISANPDTLGARLFLNALLDADETQPIGQPIVEIPSTGWVDPDSTRPIEVPVGFGFQNVGGGVMRDVVMTVRALDGPLLVDTAGGTRIDDSAASWELGWVGRGEGAGAEPVVSFAFQTHWSFLVTVEYRIGDRTLTAEQTVDIDVSSDDDGEGGSTPAGCCSTGSRPTGTLVLALLAGTLLRRRRRA